MIVGDVSIESCRGDSRSAGSPPGWWLEAPSWAESIVAGGAVHREALRLETGHELALSWRAAGRWQLLSARLDPAGGSSRADTGRLASIVYGSLVSRMTPGGGPGLSPVRFWNFLPEIHAPERDGLDRYRVFNIGRHAALMGWYGSEDAFARLLPTATGVGHDGRELVVHCLAGEGRHESLENPRQRPAYRYSWKFGPIAPSFARATIMRGADGRRALVIGGTASVRGEESVHLGDSGAQLEEALDNLRALIVHACAGCRAPAFAGPPLGRMESLRVYYVRPGDLQLFRRRLASAMPNADAIEFVRAVICRPELLVEIEGVARIDAVCPHNRGAP